MCQHLQHYMFWYIYLAFSIPFCRKKHCQVLSHIYTSVGFIGLPIRMVLLH